MGERKYTKGTKGIPVHSQTYHEKSRPGSPEVAI